MFASKASTRTTCLLTFGCIFINNVFCWDEYYCDNLQECSGDTITGYDEIECNGFKSCTKTSISNVKDVGIYGFKAGVGAKIRAEDWIDCSGYLGCAGNTKLITSGEDSQINCDSYNSCKNAEIESNYLLNLRGYRAAPSAKISDTTYVAAYGYQTLYDPNTSGHTKIERTKNIVSTGSESLRSSTINTNGLDQFTLYAVGYYSMMDATINCHSGVICNIYCFYMDCKGLTLNCLGNSDDCIVTYNNDYSKNNYGINTLLIEQNVKKVEPKIVVDPSIHEMISTIKQLKIDTEKKEIEMKRKINKRREKYEEEEKNKIFGINGIIGIVGLDYETYSIIGVSIIILMCAVVGLIKYFKICSGNGYQQIKNNNVNGNRRLNYQTI